ncbi:hypothetical protein [Risungbinella massiliensis]|nr:hypothetical protein [Risungbinella massiliensis]
MAKKRKEKQVRSVSENDLLVRDLKLMGLWFSLAIVISGVLAFAINQFS